MSKTKTRWGWNQADGVWFFFEVGREKQSFCPLQEPSVDLYCPHQTPKDENPLERIEPAIYWTTKKVEFMRKYNVRHSSTKYCGVKTLSTLREMALETNYVPIIIQGAKVSEDWRPFCLRLERLVDELGRSVVLELSDEYVPILQNWKELKNIKQLGLKEI